MSSGGGTRKPYSAVAAERNGLLKLPPIPQLKTTKDRFDNSPLLKYRRANEVQQILTQKV